MWGKVRKFGLEHCDLPTMIWNVAFMLRALTLNIDRRFEERIPVIFYLTLPVVAFCYTYTYFVSMAWFVFVRCTETKDLTAAMIVFSLGITSQIGIAKFINTCLYREKIRNILEDYLEFDATTLGSRFTSNLLLTLRSVKRRALIYWVVIISNGLLYILKPLVTPGRTSMEDIFILYKLEPEFESPNYELTYISSALGSVLTCYVTSNMAAFLIIVAGYVEAQLLALSEELLNLWNDVIINFHPELSDEVDENVYYESYSTINKLVELKLKQIIISHTKTTNLLLSIEDIFSLAFAFEFLVLSVGLIAELLGGLENTYMQVPFAIIQVGMDCLTGQRVMDASDVFMNAVYECRWEEFDASNMRTVLVMLVNSQKTLKLTAGGIAILNFATLMSVFRSVYSAFTTLQSVM